MAAQLGPFLGRPSDAYLPLGMPGSRNDDRYPLARPDLATARAFLGIAPPLASSAAFTSLRVEAIDDEGSAP